MTALWWRNEAAYSVICAETCVLPATADGGQPLTLWWSPDGPVNEVGSAVGKDGSRVQADWRISDLQRAWLLAYWADAVAAGDFAVLDDYPVGWAVAREEQ